MDYNIFKSKIESAFKEKIGIDLSDIQSKQFFDFMNLLIEKNKVMNLTAIVEPDDVILKHFVDSCIPLKFKFGESKLSNDSKIFFEKKLLVDVGTGAGFPGIPLAIVCTKADFVLTDTLGKRINFLEDVVKLIGLSNVKLIKARVEDFANDAEYRESFDYVLSRGVAKVSVLSEYSLPLAKIGGEMLAWKMDNCNEELLDGEKAVKTLGGMFHVKHSYSIIDGEPKRCLLEIYKTQNCSKSYPRQAGTPSKKPLS